MPQPDPATAAAPKLKPLFKLSLLVGFLLVLNDAGSLVVEQINFQLWPEHEHLIITALWFSIGVYILCMTMPFVPGIELGLALMVMLGPKGVLLVSFAITSLPLLFFAGKSP